METYIPLEGRCRLDGGNQEFMGQEKWRTNAIHGARGDSSHRVYIEWREQELLAKGSGKGEDTEENKIMLWLEMCSGLNPSGESCMVHELNPRWPNTRYASYYCTIPMVPEYNLLNSVFFLIFGLCPMVFRSYS